MKIEFAVDHAAARTELRAAELALMQQRESVAAMRRDLPPGPIVDDYEFGSSNGPVRLSELFGAADRPLVLYHFMFGAKQTSPCPMCSMWADGWNAVEHHLAENLDLALVTAATVDDNERLAVEHGWTQLRWLSAVGTTFKTDFGSQDGDGNQQPFVTVFELDAGAPRLTYSGGAHIDGDHWRGIDLLSPVWHFLDLTRAGAGCGCPDSARPAERLGTRWPHARSIATGTARDRVCPTGDVVVTLWWSVSIWSELASLSMCTVARIDSNPALP